MVQHLLASIATEPSRLMHTWKDTHSPFCYFGGCDLEIEFGKIKLWIKPVVWQSDWSYYYGVNRWNSPNWNTDCIYITLKIKNCICLKLFLPCLATTHLWNLMQSSTRKTTVISPFMWTCLSLVKRNAID